VTLLLIDRFTGKPAHEPPANVLPGRWLVALPGTYILNRVRAEGQLYLVSDDRGVWSLSDAGERTIGEGLVDRLASPAAVLASSIDLVAKELGQSASSGWNDWVDVSPLAPGTTERAELQPLEREMIARITHLEAVFRRPRMLLRTEVEHMPVERARRMPARSSRYLAAHSEDWERRTLRSVRPKRLLANVTEDDLAIYENRVAVRLVEQLLRYLTRRLDELRRLEQFFIEADELQRQAQGSYWRARRVFTLIGESFNASGNQRRAALTRRALLSVRWRLLSLLDSPLYAAIPANAAVQRSLRSTNIFANDERYRHVATLWRAWVQHDWRPTPDPREILDTAQALCQNYEAYCGLLIARALSEDGFSPSTIGFPTRGAPPLELRGYLGDVALSWGHDGVFSLSLRGTTGALRFVPLAANLTSNATTLRTAVESVLERPDGKPRPRSAWRATHSPTTAQASDLTIVLYPGASFERAALPPGLARHAYSLGNDRFPGEPRSVGFLPVSPLEVDSLERVGRAIRWWLFDHVFMAYPPRIDCPTRLASALAGRSRWLTLQGSNTVLATRPPSEYEWSDLEQQLSEWLGLAKTNPRLAPARPGELERALSELRVARAELTRLARCPTCADDVPPLGGFHPLQEDRFSCRCASCGTSWGTRACGTCGGTFPSIELGVLIHVNAGSVSSVDRLLGRDMLATLCPFKASEGTVICPRCGVCPDAHVGKRQGCARCSVETGIVAESGGVQKLTEVRLYVVSEPLWTREETGIKRIRERMSTSNLRSCALVVGYHHQREGRRSVEADLILVCEYGLFFTELKDWTGRVIIPASGGASVEVQQPFRQREWRDNPIRTLWNQERLAKDVVEEGWPDLLDSIFGLAIFTNSNVELIIGPQEHAQATIGEVGIGTVDDVPALISRLARAHGFRDAAGRAEPVLMVGDVWRVAEYFAEGAAEPPGVYPRRVGSIILHREVEPWVDGADYRLFQAAEEGTNTPLLVKEVTLQQLGPDERREAVTYMFRSAQALRRLGDHPFVLNFRLAHRSDDGRHLYVAYERADARPVRLYLDRKDWSTRARLVFLANILRALRHVHERGLIHRDLTPDNILFERRTGRPRLANFDLSRIEGQQSLVTHAQRVLQSRGSGYAAPELLAAQEPADVDSKCDVYSVGVVSIEVLTGAGPGNPSSDVAAGIASAGLSSEFADFVNGMLSRNPLLRPSSAEALEMFQREASTLAAVETNL
jgi:Protein kinase domain